MKKLTSIIASIALGTSFLTCAGLGIARATNAFDKDSKDASAAAVASGSLIIKKDNGSGDWTSRTKLVGYFYNGSTNAWGDAVTNNSSIYQEYSWSLSFTPTNVIFLNVADNWSSSWDNPWWSPNCRTGNVSLDNTDVVWMKSDASDNNSNWGSYSLETYVKGGASDSWSTATVNTELTNVKTDGTKIEVYGEVSLPANTYFKVVQTGNGSEVWCGSYTCLDAIKGNLSNSASGNIHNTAAAKYEFYFNFDGQTTYITDPVVAAADEWAQYFTANVGCDSTGAKAPSGWSTVASSYSSLDGDVKDYIYAGTALKGGTYLEDALYTYDLAVSHHSITKFITNSSGTVRAVISNNNKVIAPNNSVDAIPIAAIIAVISITVIGSLASLKFKRKEN